VSGRVEGKVAFITGAARGQGRSHAVRLSEEGADIIAVDALMDYPSVPYPMAGSDDLCETVALVEALGRRIVASRVDVRDAESLGAAVDEGVARLGRLDIVSANAGICTVQAWDDVSPEIWKDTLDTNLTGVWNTMVAAVPHLITSGGGSIIATSSVAGIKGLPFLAPYVASKHGVVGIARSLAHELARPMLAGLGGLQSLIDRDPDLGGIFDNSLPVTAIPARDVSEAVLFLASDDSRYVTGLEFTIDAGATIR
jgi:NAD(P)-dependent dehydrogenase (short-subunit alcohol dehydrogenase family)